MAASAKESIAAIRQSKPSHIEEGEEVYGRLDSIIPLDSETIIAQIGKRAVYLPSGLGSELPIGQRISILRLDTDDAEYHVLALEAAA